MTTTTTTMTPTPMPMPLYFHRCLDFGNGCSCGWCWTQPNRPQLHGNAGQINKNNKEERTWLIGNCNRSSAARNLIHTNCNSIAGGGRTITPDWHADRSYLRSASIGNCIQRPSENPGNWNTIPAARVEGSRPPTQVSAQSNADHRQIRKQTTKQTNAIPTPAAEPFRTPKWRLK